MSFLNENLKNKKTIKKSCRCYVWWTTNISLIDRFCSKGFKFTSLSKNAFWKSHKKIITLKIWVRKLLIIKRTNITRSDIHFRDDQAFDYSVAPKVNLVILYILTDMCFTTLLLLCLREGVKNKCRERVPKYHTFCKKYSTPHKKSDNSESQTFPLQKISLKLKMIHPSKKIF